MDYERFHLPEGAALVGSGADTFTLSVEIPLDEHGFFGRQCPSCSQVFRVAHDDYEALPGDLVLWCVYCGHHEDHSEFMTEQQKARLLRPATDIARQMVGEMLDNAFGGMARQSPRRGGFISISVSYRSTPFYPEPLPDIDEESLIRERSCGTCNIRYAVFGEHRFCPVHGRLSPLTVADDALAAETARLDALTTLPAESIASLREQGVFDRIYADTVKNLVGVVETLAGDTFRAAVPNAADVTKGRGNIFQRLDGIDDLYMTHLGRPVRSSLPATTDAALVGVWAARHVFVHRDGIVDDRYLATVLGATTAVGQRLTLSESLVRAAIVDVRTLCDVLVGQQPSSTASAPGI